MAPRSPRARCRLGTIRTSTRPSTRHAASATRTTAPSSGCGDRAGAGRVIDAADVPAAVEAFIRVADGIPWKDAGIPGIPARVAQDVRGYYETAALGLADHAPAAWSTTRWFFDETEAGRVVLDARAAMRDAGIKQPIWFYMAPGDR